MADPMPSGEMKEIVTATAKIWLGEDDIVHLEPHARRQQTLEDAVENVAAVGRLAGEERRPLLIHFQAAAPQTPECRAYYASEKATTAVRKVAIVTSSMLGRVIGNLMIGMNESVTPVRLFDRKERALEWLAATPPSSQNRQVTR
jgi:hypothetical protein